MEFIWDLFHKVYDVESLVRVGGLVGLRLLEKGVKPDSNALKVAVEKKHWKMAELLMNNGATPTPDVVEAFEKNK